MPASKNRVKKMSSKPVISGLFFVCCSVTLTVYGADYDAELLNKLFTDKNQRAQIDASRSGKTSTAGTKKSSNVNVSGYVTRSEGKSVVWLNNKNTLKRSTVAGARVHQSSIGKNKKVTVTVGNKTTRIKPGETWSVSSGKVKDSY